MKNCKLAEEWMQRSLDTPLTVAERAALDLHVEGCDSCRARWREYRALSRVASAWLAPEDGNPASDVAFQDAVLRQIEALPRPAPIVWRSVAWMSGATCAFVLAAVLVGGPWVTFLSAHARGSDLLSALPPVPAPSAIPSEALGWSHGWHMALRGLLLSTHGLITTGRGLVSIGSGAYSGLGALELPVWTGDLLVAALCLNIGLIMVARRRARRSIAV